VNPRITLAYWPVRDVLGRTLPALAIHQRPNPNCPDCDGFGYTAFEPDCSDEAPCTCTREKPYAVLPLPRMANKHYREYRRRQRRAAKAWTCWFCSAENGAEFRSCLSCGRRPES
jgi:hypothetical protein